MGDKSVLFHPPEDSSVVKAIGAQQASVFGCLVDTPAVLAGAVRAPEVAKTAIAAPIFPGVISSIGDTRKVFTDSWDRRNNMKQTTDMFKHSVTETAEKEEHQFEKRVEKEEHQFQKRVEHEEHHSEKRVEHEEHHSEKRVEQEEHQFEKRFEKEKHQFEKTVEMEAHQRDKKFEMKKHDWDWDKHCGQQMCQFRGCGQMFVDTDALQRHLETHTTAHN